MDNGSADNRYHVFGHSRHYEDLFKLDQMVFMLRRLCQPLDAYYHLEPQADPEHEFTWRDLLREKPERFHISMNNRLEKIILGKVDGPLRHVLMNMNFPFAGDDYEHANFANGWATRESTLYMTVYRSIKCNDPGEQQIGRDACRWVLNNIQLPKNAREEMESWLKCEDDDEDPT
jgi:hypothetical protein